MNYGRIFSRAPFTVIFTASLYFGSCGGDGGTSNKEVFGINGNNYCDALNRALDEAMSKHLTLDQSSLPRLYERAMNITVASRPSLNPDGPIESKYRPDAARKIYNRIYREGRGTDSKRLSTCEDLAFLQNIWNETPLFQGLSAQSLESDQSAQAKLHLPDLDPQASLIASTLEPQVKAGTRTSTAVFPLFISAFLSSMDLFSRYEISRMGSSFDFGVRFQTDAYAEYDRKLPAIVTVDSVRTQEKSLQPGDQVTAIHQDGKWRSVEGMEVSELESFFASNASQRVKVKVNRKASSGQPESKEVTIEGSSKRAFGGSRPSVAGELVGDLIYVKLYEFDSGAAQQVSDEISSLLTQWAIRQTSQGGTIPDTQKPAIIFDLRFNGGGSLDEALAILGLFLPYQKLGTMVYRNEEVDFYPLITRSQFNNPLFVLVNHGSASASELTTQVLQETGRALVIGERTFGKGIGQDSFELGIGSSIEGRIWVTTFRFLGPTGNNIQMKGIVPDMELNDSQILSWMKEASTDCDQINRKNFRRCIHRMEDFKKNKNLAELVIDGRPNQSSSSKPIANSIKPRIAQLQSQARQAEEIVKASGGLGGPQAIPSELRNIIKRDEVTVEVSKIANQLLKP